MTTIELAAAVIRDIFDAAVADIPDNARASVTTLSPHELVVALEVSRKRGDWQRNIVVTLTGHRNGGWQIDSQITDEEQIAVVRLADVTTIAVADVLEASVSIARSALTVLRFQLAD